MQANTKYVSYTSRTVSGGQLAGVSRHSSNVHSICTCVISGTGVTTLNFVFSASMHTGTYFSNNTTRAAFSVACSRVSVQLATYGLQPRSVELMYKIPARDTVAGVADRRLDTSNNSRMDCVNAIRSLLANVNTCAIYNTKICFSKKFKNLRNDFLKSKTGNAECVSQRGYVFWQGVAMGQSKICLMLFFKTERWVCILRSSKFQIIWALLTDVFFVPANLDRVSFSNKRHSNVRLTVII